MEHLASYQHALRSGWPPATHRPEAGRVDPEGKGPSIPLPDGSTVPRLPGYRRWMWDGEFCGAIAFRWRPGTTELPPSCRGHIGYSVVAWKRRRGYATRALRLLPAEVRATGLPYVELTTDVENAASQRVIEAAGGVRVRRFALSASHGPRDAFLYRVALEPGGG